MKRFFSLQSAICLLLSFVVWHPSSVLAAGGGADYGRGPETDPIATPILSTATSNVATLQGQVNAVQNRTGTWNQAATDGITATSAIPRIASMEGRTSTWNQAATDGITATSAIPRIASMEGRTSTWEQAATDGITATSAIPRIASMEGRTSTWNQAATDGSSWTNAQAVALKSITNTWTDTNGVSWYVVMSAAGMITHWSTNAP